jgi:hypothetical protein
VGSDLVLRKKVGVIPPFRRGFLSTVHSSRLEDDYLSNNLESKTVVGRRHVSSVDCTVLYCTVGPYCSFKNRNIVFLAGWDDVTFQDGIGHIVIILEGLDLG